MDKERKEEPRLNFKVYRSYVRNIRERNKTCTYSFEAKLFTIGFILTIIGMIITIIAPLIGGLQLSSSSGAIVIIWPFIPIPIGIAWGPYGRALGATGAIIALILLLLFLIMYKRR